ncbi:aspartate/tyrosine/aromatic aminotransferase [Leucothrix sargassi]|nr:aspartate/tyrosine/aromatic aminotransferase [Leucothrix sargassi]
MFEKLSPPKPDAILALLATFNADTRPDKMNLGVGVYMNEKGETIILDSVKKAEARLLEAETTKTYVGLSGDKGYNQAMQEIVFGDSIADERINGVQATGGSGALRVLSKLMARMRTDAKVYVSTPTWPNHYALLQTEHSQIEHYPYFDAETCSVDFAAMTAKLKTLTANDVVVLHGCCHNPTGANLTNEQWDEVAAIAKEVGFLPFVDIAYQGFGDSLEADAYGVRKLASTLDEMLVAVSCSKNFGIYRDRVGCAFAIGKDKASADLANANMQNISRGIYSMPPDHGASVVRIIWEDPALRQQWQDELVAMCSRMTTLRNELADEFKRQSGGDKFEFIRIHRGMFSLLGLSVEQVVELREAHGIYMIEDSRVNIAGLQVENMPRLVEAVLAVS